MRFNPEAAAPAKEYQAALIQPDGSSVWIGHPDAKVDVAVMAVNGERLKADGIRFHFFENDNHTATRARMRDVGIGEGDGVFALGFPLGLVGGDRNYVIVRQGVLARIRDTLAGASSDFLVDLAIFPGNSGGPVILRPESTAIGDTLAQDTAYLLGIVSSYLPYQDIAISAQTKRARIIFEENTGLASVFPVDFIDETIEEHRRRGTAEAPPAPPEDNDRPENAARRA
jgi:S1-C subfamily serine protease